MKQNIEERLYKIVSEYSPDIYQKSKSCKNIHYNPIVDDWYPNLETHYLKYGKIYFYIPLDVNIPILAGFTDINKKINILPDSLYHNEIHLSIVPIIEEYNKVFMEQERLRLEAKELNRLKKEEEREKKRLKEEQIKKEKEAKDLEEIVNYLNKMKL